MSILEGMSLDQIASAIHLAVVGANEETVVGALDSELVAHVEADSEWDFLLIASYFVTHCMEHKP